MKTMITCPKCAQKFEVSEAIRQDMEERFARENAEILEKERDRLEKKGAQKAALKLTAEMSELRESLLEKEKALEEARRLELATRKKQRELADREKSMQIDLQRTLDAERAKIAEDAGKSALDLGRQKLAEKDLLIDGMKKQIDELQQRAAGQSSQKLQGTAREDILEETLRSAFPCDIFERIRNGKKGGDLIQRVRMPDGKHAGTILYESKRARLWSHSWTAKLKEDQRQAGADVAVLVSDVVPEDAHPFGRIGDVLVSEFSCVTGLAGVLRAGLVETARARRHAEATSDHAELLLRYISSTGFRQSVCRIVETFQTMNSDLEKEKSAMRRIWAKREAQAGAVLGGVADIIGQIQGFTNALPDLAVLELPEAS